jgi:hypothetical protein
MQWDSRQVAADRESLGVCFRFLDNAGPVWTRTPPWTGAFAQVTQKVEMHSVSGAGWQKVASQSE